MVYYPGGNETVILANFQGADPNQENVEINVRRNCFYPDKTGVDILHSPALR